MVVSCQLCIFREQAALCCSQLSQLLNHTAAMWHATTPTIVVLAGAYSGFVLLGLGSEMPVNQNTATTIGTISRHQLLVSLQS